MDIEKLHDQLKKGQTSVFQYIENIYKTIKENDLNSYISLNEEEALKEARKLDDRLKKGEEPDGLFAVPFAIKDNVLTKGLRTTAASKALEDFVPIYDASIVEKLKEEDAIIIGKTNLDEFAMGGSSETSYFGPTANPYDRDLIPGGSSAGSAAAVAGGECLLAIGTDTGGSCRNPANYCNVVGFAPSYGSISRYGVMSMANSFDRVGLIGKNIADIRKSFELLAGKDKRDMTSLDLERGEKIDSLKGIKIAAIRLKEDYEVEDQVRDNYLEAIEVLKNEGAKIDFIDLDLLDLVNPTYSVIMSVEVNANMARIDGLRYGNSVEDYQDTDDFYMQNRTLGFGEEVKRRIALGSYFSSKDNKQIYYKKAMRVRELLKEEFDEIFSTYDIFLSPTTTDLPYEYGAKSDEGYGLFDSGMFNMVTNLVDLPSISIPVSQDKLGSIQLTGKRRQDYSLLDVSELVERSLS